MFEIIIGQDYVVVSLDQLWFSGFCFVGIVDVYFGYDVIFDEKIGEGGVEFDWYFGVL